VRDESENLKGRDNLGNLGIDGRIILITMDLKELEYEGLCLIRLAWITSRGELLVTL
jgi:hypothetical protein